MSKYLKSNFHHKSSNSDEQLADALLANPHRIEIIGAVLRETREANYIRQGFVWEDEQESIGHLINKPDEIHRPPGDDHGRLFRRKEDGKPCLYHSMPYGYRSKALPAIVEFCEQHGLKATFDAYDIWYPGRTVSVMYYVDHDLTPKFKV